jgi:hypothetical protein
VPDRAAVEKQGGSQRVAQQVGGDFFLSPEIFRKRPNQVTAVARVRGLALAIAFRITVQSVQYSQYSTHLLGTWYTQKAVVSLFSPLPLICVRLRQNCTTSAPQITHHTQLPKEQRAVNQEKRAWTWQPRGNRVIPKRGRICTCFATSITLR